MLVRVIDTEFGYGSNQMPVFEGLSLALEAGETVGITGASGSGKTTLLEILCGNLRPSRGQIVWNDHSHSVSYAPQADVLVEFRSTFENAALLLESGRIRKAQRREGLSFIRAAFAKAGLSQHAWRPPSELSGGMRQRVQVIQALAVPAQLLMLDEPFSEQDLDQQRKLEGLVRERCQSLRQGAIVVSHDMSALAALCDRTLFLGGKPSTVAESVMTPPSVRAEGRSSAQFADFELELWAHRAKVAEL